VKNWIPGFPDTGHTHQFSVISLRGAVARLQLPAEFFVCHRLGHGQGSKPAMPAFHAGIFVNAGWKTGMAA
jgi:hypothetical protein